jgi:hypothetical protein
MSEEPNRDVDFNKYPLINWINQIIKQIGVCTQKICNEKTDFPIALSSLQGLFTLFDEAGKEHFKEQIVYVGNYWKFGYPGTWNLPHPTQFYELEEVLSLAVNYLQSTILKDLKGYTGVDVGKEMKDL